MRAETPAEVTMTESREISVKKCLARSIMQRTHLLIFTLCLFVGNFSGALSSPVAAAAPYEKIVVAARPHQIEGLHSGGITGSENIREFKMQIRVLRPDNQKSKAGFSYPPAVLCDAAHAVLIATYNIFHSCKTRAVRSTSLRTQQARAPPLSLLS